MDSSPPHRSATIFEAKPPYQPKAPTDRKARKVSKSLFSIKNGQSLASQLDDTFFVVRQIILSSRTSPSPKSFAKRFVLQPIFKNDLFVISFGLPALSATPRVLDAAPSNRSDASDWTYQGTRTATARVDLLNVASYNYLGFVDFEYNTRKLLEYAVGELPFADDEQGCNARLEEALKSELKGFMGFEGCVLTATGYAINLVAFPAMASVAATTRPGANGERDLRTIFLMDSESHSSMFMGAFIACSSGNGQVMKFRHNDVNDLKTKLEQIYHDEDTMRPIHASKNIWVTIEGIYSMEGSLPPLREIIALKHKYGFGIYIDEAHSFLAIGSNGRGVVEHFLDNSISVDSAVNMRDIDMLGGTLSKSLSSVGGFVLSSGPLKQHIEARISVMRSSGASPMPTLSLIRTLQIIKKQGLVSQRLAHLRSISEYVATALKAKGYRISTTEGGPLIAIIVDTVDRVLAFLRIGREVGLICCGAAYPAAPRGAPRVRLSLTGAHSWQDVHEMLMLIDQIAIVIGVKGLNVQKAAVKLSEKEAFLQSNLSTPMHEINPVRDSDAIDSAILGLCPPAMQSQHANSTVIRSAGLAALSKFNLGAAGPRWMYGTFSAHLSLEDLLNSTFKSMVASIVASNRPLNPFKTTLFTESRVGIMSIIANVRREGVAAANRDRSVVLRWYETDDGQDGLNKILDRECKHSAKLHLTTYLDTTLFCPSTANNNFDQIVKSTFSPLTALLTSQKSTRPLSTTLILNDSSIFETNLTSTRTILSSLTSLYPSLFTSSNSRFLLFGSFNTMPNLSGLQGAFCTGSHHLVEKVQFLGQGVMYTAMMPPLNAALVEEGLKGMLTRK